MKISEERYCASRGNYDGFCRACRDITNFGGVEPDAENYVCEDCGKNTVMGIELALIMGLVETDNNIKYEEEMFE